MNRTGLASSSWSRLQPGCDVRFLHPARLRCSSSSSAFGSRVLVGDEPLLELLGVALTVGGAAADLVLDGLEGAAEGARVLVGEEGLDVVDGGEVGELAERDLDEAVDDDGVAELGDAGVPVGLDVVPLQLSGGRVAGEGGAEGVHVGGGDRVRGGGGRGLVEEEGEEGVLDGFGVADKSEVGEADLLAVDGRGREPLLLEGLDGAGGVVLDGDAEDGGAEGRVQGVGLGGLDPGVEALGGLLRDAVCMTLGIRVYLPSVAVDTGSHEDSLAQEAVEVALALGEVPAHLGDNVVDQLQGEGLEALLDGLVVAEDGLDEGDGVEDLTPHEVVVLLGEALDEGQQGGGGAVAGEGEVGGRADDGDLVLGAEAVELLAELQEALRRVVDAVEAGGARVELVELGVDVADRVLLLLEGQRRDALGTDLALELERDPPGGLVVLGLDVARRQEAGLLDGDLAGLLGDGQDGVADLGDPGAHQLVDVLAGGLGEGIPQRLGLCVAVLVGLEVVGHALEEGVDAEVVGEHADRRAALEVADVVEDLVDVEGVLDGHVDGVAGADAVQLEGHLHALIDELRPHLPLRVEVVGRVPSDPGGEALVEPELVPPVHGDEVAEPLVSQLVGDDVGDAVAVPRLGRLLVEEDGGGAVGDETPVLHGAVGELVDSEQVGLGEGVLDAEDVGEEVNDAGRVPQGPAALLLEAAGGVDADGQLLAVVAALGELLDVLEVADGPGEEVGAHLGAGLEGDELPAVLGLLGVLDGHVAEGDLVVGDLNLKVEGGLEVGLVEAGEGAAGVAGLELGAEHVVPLVVAGHRLGGLDGGLVLAAVEAGHLVVDDSLELDGEDGLLGLGDLLVKGDGGALLLLAVAEV
ncbi:hypothetical protein ColLi_06525 [Colletotrichum liriopes]|uniref:Uncharacterized protein n=1 Tax=Colletotrichum liriopes TaxID=708192 RepID=A0AA37GNI7_9PEZI|nr:hypothetical protein ColLi_06525 [Colletotrichum liriopes]